MKLPFSHTFSPKLQFLLFFLVIAMVLGLSIFTNYMLGFYSVYESESYFRFFLGDFSFPIKLFYYPMTDLYYRARELKTLLHIFDTYCILWMAKIHIFHLLSVVYYLLLIGILLLGLYHSYKTYKAKFIFITTLLSLCFLTTPAVFLSGFYFNPSKILVAFDISLGIFLLSSMQRWDSTVKTNLKAFGIIVLLTLGMGLSDEQGIVYSLLFMLYAFFMAIIRKNSIMKVVGLGFVIGNECMWLYRSILGPFITSKITGLNPTIWGIDDLPTFYMQNVFRAIQLIGIYLHYFFGLFPIPYVFLLLGVLTIFIYLILRKSHTTIRASLLITFVITSITSICFIVMFYFLMMRLDVLTWPEFSIIYYPLPFYAFLFCIIHVLCLAVSNHYRKLILPIIICTIVWFEANLYSLPKQMETLQRKEINTHVYFNLTPILIEAIKDPNIPIKSILFDHYETISILRKRLYGTK
jgi:hypothetical protein